MPESQTAGTAVSGSLQQPPPPPEWFSYDVLLHDRCGRKLSEHPMPHAPAADCPFPALPPREFARVTSPARGHHPGDSCEFDLGPGLHNLGASPARGGPDTAGVDPAEIRRQRELGWPDFHPEDYCHHCGRPNPCWFADTTEWQTATGSTGDGGGILCPSCFAALWEQQTGKVAVIWRLSIDPRSRDARGPDTAGMREAPDPRFRDQLTEALHRHQGLRGNDDIVRTLLPVVRKIVAEELRAAADEPEMPMNHVRDWLRERADALAAAAQPTDRGTR